MAHNNDIAESVISRLLDLAEQTQKKLNFLSDVAAVKGVVLTTQMDRFGDIVEATFVAAQVLQGTAPKEHWASFPQEVKEAIYWFLLSLQAELDGSHAMLKEGQTLDALSTRMALCGDGCFHAATYLGYPAPLAADGRAPNPDAWAILYLAEGAEHKDVKAP